MHNQELQDKLDHHLAFLAQDKDNISLLIEISDLYQELNDINTAQTYLDKANSINREACLGHQGLLYLNQGLLDQAKTCFNEALTYGDSPALRYNLGFCHFMTYEFENAWAVLSPILDGEHFADAELLMARILQRQDALDDAIHLVENILTHNPNDVEALGLLSLLYFDLNEDTLAKQTAQKALAINPEVYDARLVDILTRLMTQETTIEEIEDLLQINPQDSRLWFALGTTYMTQGNLESAKMTLQKAIELFPGFYDCLISLAWCQLLSNQIDEAQTAYQNAANLVEELADAWGGLALVYALKEDFIKAEQLIDKANALNFGCFLTEIAESICFNHTTPQKAKEHLIKALKSPDVPISEKLAFVMEDIQNQEQLH